VIEVGRYAPVEPTSFPTSSTDFVQKVIEQNTRILKVWDLLLCVFLLLNPLHFGPLFLSSPYTLKKTRAQMDPAVRIMLGL